MKLLIVSATAAEVDITLNKLKIDKTSLTLSCAYKHITIDFLIAGVGMVETAYQLTKKLQNKYDFVLNAGICGAFNANLKIGELVHIYEDRFSELGAEDNDAFLSLEQMGLRGTTKVTNHTFKQIPNKTLQLLPLVNGITVNKVHGNEKSIEKVFGLFHPYTESMEGAAFMYVCEQEKVSYAQIRAVSNHVEKRNRDKWNIPLAVENLNAVLWQVINDFTK